MKRAIAGGILLFLFVSCDNPFNVTPTDEEKLFQLNLSHSIKRIATTGAVTLEWSEVIVEDFSKYVVERRPVGSTPWQPVVEITNRIQSKYVDTIRDDEDLEYRVGIMDQTANVRWAEATIQIPRTRQLYVPEERLTIQQAVYDSLIDDGDTIWVSPGTYRGTINFLERNIVIKSLQGAEQTFLVANALHPGTVVTMNMGLLEGFTISGGDSRLPGGGVVLRGTGIVRRCIITNNSSWNYGGGIYISEEASLMNSIIYDNSAFQGNNVYFKDAHGEIINNTITFVDKVRPSSVAFGKKNQGLNLQNNIIANPQNYGNITLLDTGVFSGVVLNYCLMEPSFSGVNQNGVNDADPEFIGYSDSTEVFDFHLSPTSPAINSGNPLSEYNNPDGSRNTMGAYGGPYGE